MLVPVVRVRKVRMPMRLRLMAVPMAVFSAGSHRIGVSVLMMLVVRVFVFVLERLVRMFVFVPLGQM